MSSLADIPGQMAVKRAVRALRWLALCAGLFACAVPQAPYLPDETLTPSDDLRDIQDLPEVSQDLSVFYLKVQNTLLSRGLMRTDGGEADAPFGRREVVQNFLRIALYEEYTTIGGRVVARQTESQLHRWERPILLEVKFGATVPQAKRETDLYNLRAYARRLQRVTGIPVRLVTENGNFKVYIVNELERRALAPEITAFIPGVGRAAINTVVNMERETFCLVFAFDGVGSGAYSKAVAIIRGEHPDLMRLSCIHEEIAQGLGLSNDSPRARPSVFNDDEEFGLLTPHDELLLRILYDRRMRTGMTLKEAGPVANIVAAELLGDLS